MDGVQIEGERHVESDKRWKIATIGIAVVLLLSLLFLPACCCVREPGQTARVPHHELPASVIGQQQFDLPEEATPASATSTEMRNVHFWLASDLVLNIHELHGTMAAKEEGKPLNFDDKSSFIVDIHDATVGIAAPDLEHLMNHYVFNGPEAPLRDLSITIEDGQIVQEGILHKLIDIPFRMRASAQLTDDGRLRLHPESIEICELPGKSLMRAFGMTLEDVMDLRNVEGVTADGNDLLIDPLSILPPPVMRGTITEIRVENGELVQVFSSDSPWEPLDPPLDRPNYMFFRHGTLRMGKLLMVRADMQVADSDPSDPFEFFLDLYNQQLVAGYTENLADYGLLVVMRDIDDVGSPVRAGEALCNDSPCKSSPAVRSE